MSEKAFPKFDCDLVFAPGQHGHSIGLVVMETAAELQSLLAEYQFESVDLPEEDALAEQVAACCFDYEGKEQFGFVIVARETLTPALLAHELCHAAMAWVTCQVMTSAPVQAKTPVEQDGYFTEACAYALDALYEQAFAFLYEVPVLKMKEEMGKPGWRVWIMNDCDWWLARTAEEAVRGCREHYGSDDPDLCFDEVLPMTSQQLQAHFFAEDNGVTRTFEAELAARIAAGPQVEMFATTEI